MTTALTYATEEEMNAMTEAFNKYRFAKEDVARIQKTLLEVQDKLFEASRYRPREYASAAARALGETVEATPVVVQPYVDTGELHAQEQGLKQRLTDAEAEVQYAHGTVKRAAHDLLRQVANRIGAEYVERSKQLGWLWAQIAAIEGIAGHGQKVVPMSYWNKLRVPGTDFVPSIKAGSREEYGETIVLTADRLAGDVTKARREIAEHGKELFGEWPL